MNIKLLLLISFLLCVVSVTFSQNQKRNVEFEKGKTLAAQCITCHKTTTAALADPLPGIRKIRSANYIFKLIKNPMQFADENKTAKQIFAKRGLQMPPFPDLSKNDIKAILDYIDGLPHQSASEK